MDLLLLFSAFVLSLLLVIITVPPIIRTAKAKGLFEPFEERKIHTKIVPPLGGVAIFIAFVLSTIICTDGFNFTSLKYIIAGVIILFFIGLKDDLMILSARKKLVVQIIAALIITIFGNIRFTNLHNILGTGEIAYVPSIIFSVFVAVVIINAFNLIDGIDGLSSGLGMIASLFFGTWFFMNGYTPFAVMSLALAGSLFGFFLYNVFGDTHKLFMGDTGSLILGLLVTTMVIRFNELNFTSDSHLYIQSAPSVSFAVIIVPLIDTLRVMTIRILQKRSPFSPDKNHIHHRLLEMIPSHLAVTSIICAGNLLIIAFALWLNQTGINTTLQFAITVSVGLIAGTAPSLLLRMQKRTTRRKTSAI